MTKYQGRQVQNGPKVIFVQSSSYIQDCVGNKVDTAGGNHYVSRNWSCQKYWVPMFWLFMEFFLHARALVMSRMAWVRFRDAEQLSSLLLWNGCLSSDGSRGRPPPDGVRPELGFPGLLLGLLLPVLYPVSSCLHSNIVPVNPGSFQMHSVFSTCHSVSPIPSVHLDLLH